MTLRGVDLRRWRQPGRAAQCQHDNPVRLSYRRSRAWTVRSTMPRSSAIHVPVPGQIWIAPKGWCGRWESNPHSLRNGIFSRTRLPQKDTEFCGHNCGRVRKVAKASSFRSECASFCVSQDNICAAALAATPFQSPRRRGDVGGKTRTRGRLRLCTPDSLFRFSIFANQSASGASQKPERRCPWASAAELGGKIRCGKRQ
jgi:hypothetical protein